MGVGGIINASSWNLRWTSTTTPSPIANANTAPLLP